MNNQFIVIEASSYLEKHDHVLRSVIASSTISWNPSTLYFEQLLGSIITQQLSIKVADIIENRFIDLFKGTITPEKVLAMDTEVLRKTGMSYSKASYIKNLAAHVIENPKMFEKFDEMSDEEIIAELVNVKGIGRWTAEMFLIGTIGRPDVFSYGDLGIRRAIQKLYKFDHEPTKLEAEEIAEKWKPYRSFACKYLWKSLEL